MPNNSEKILDLLRGGPAMSKDIVEATGLSKRAVSVAIGRLVENGDIQRGADGSLYVTEEDQ